jgi:hypothetical protein
MNILTILNKIQQELKIPKKRYNKFGEFYFRSCEDILEAVKPLLKKYNVAIVLSDEMVHLGDRYYIKATAVLMKEGNYRSTGPTFDYEGSIGATSYAREPENKKKMDDSQLTGTASSYARKYALNGLLCIDDTKDADTNEHHQQSGMDKSQNKEGFKPKVHQTTDKPPKPSQNPSSHEYGHNEKKVLEQKLTIAEEKLSKEEFEHCLKRFGVYNSYKQGDFSNGLLVNMRKAVNAMESLYKGGQNERI